MIRFHKEKLNGKKVKLFCEPAERKLADAVRVLYPNDCLEIYEVSPFSWIDDRAEFACYKFYTGDLPVLLTCSSENEMHVLECTKNFSV